MNLINNKLIKYGIIVILVIILFHTLFRNSNMSTKDTVMFAVVLIAAYIIVDNVLGFKEGFKEGFGDFPGAIGSYKLPDTNAPFIKHGHFNVQPYQKGGNDGFVAFPPDTLPPSTQPPPSTVLDGSTATSATAATGATGANAGATAAGANAGATATAAGANAATGATVGATAAGATGANAGATGANAGATGANAGATAVAKAAAVANANAVAKAAAANADAVAKAAAANADAVAKAAAATASANAIVKAEADAAVAAANAVAKAAAANANAVAKAAAANANEMVVSETIGSDSETLKPEVQSVHQGEVRLARANLKERTDRCRWQDDVIVSDMKYTDYNHLPMADGYDSRDYEYGYSFLPPEKWAGAHSMSSYPPICVTNKRNDIFPVLSNSATADLKEWNDSLRITNPDNINVEYIRDKLNTGR
jgi:hypothetical protein